MNLQDCMGAAETITDDMMYALCLMSRRHVSVAYVLNTRTLTETND